MSEPIDDPLASSTMSTGSAADPLSFSGFEASHAVSTNTHNGSFAVLGEEERNLPEIQRLHGFFESLESELMGVPVTRVDDGADSDKDSDDGLQKEVRKLPEASIHDLHTIVTSDQGSRLLVTPSNKQASLEGKQFPRADLSVSAEASTEAATTPVDLSNSHSSSNSNNEARTPVRVTFDQSLRDTAPGEDSPTRMPTSPKGSMPPSSGAKHGHHGFTPMTLQQLMKMETPESRVDEMLQELYNLMGYYNKDEAFGSSSTLNDLDPELSGALFASPLPAPRTGSASSAGSDGDSEAGARIAEEGGRLPDAVHTGAHPTAHHLPLSPVHGSDPLTPLSPLAGEVPLSPNTQPQAPLTPVPDAPGRSPVPVRTPLPSPAAATGSAVTQERRRLRSSSADIDRDIADIVQMSSHHGSRQPSAANSPLRADWVDVGTSSVVTSSASPPKGTSAVGVAEGALLGSAAKLHESIVHGDFYIWSEGPKLTAEYISSAYVGLNPTAVTHNNDNGVLLPATVATSASKIPGTNIPTGVYANARAGNSTEGGIASAPAPAVPKSGHGYYVVYLLECVVRPDVELRQLLEVVHRVAKTRDCRCYFPHANHLILKASAPAPQTAPGSAAARGYHGSSSEGAAASAGATSTTGELREWDQVDVQVVVSQEVKQRMLVCQFLRRVPALASSGYGNLNLIIYQMTKGTAPLTLGSSPKTKSFVSKLKRELTDNALCLSSLYNAPLESVCSLSQQPDGLDAHFRAQLQQQVYGYMWQRLEADIGQMSEYLQAQLRDCHDFQHTLEPIYRAYGLPAPLPWKSSAQRHHQHHSLPSPVPAHQQRHPPQQAPARSLSAEAASASASTPVRAPMPVSAASGLTPGGDVGTPLRGAAAEVASPQQTSHSVDLAVTPSTPSVVSRPLRHTSPRISKASCSTEDGMTVALLMVNQCLTDLQESCDEEYAQRVQLQNEWVVRQVDNMQDYKHSLLFSLASNPDAADAPIMRSFTALFADVPTTIDAAGNVAFRSSTGTSSAGNSAPGSRNNSTDRTAQAANAGTPVSALAEASLYNEFKDSPAPKGETVVLSTVNLQGPTAAQSKTRAPVPAPIPVTAASTAPAQPAANGGGWLTGFTQAISSFTASYNATSPGPKPAAPEQARRSRPTHTATGAEAGSGKAAFKPKDQRPKLSQADVNRRLDAYHNQQLRTPGGGGGSAAERADDGEESGGFTMLSPGSEVESLIALTPAVLYYCSCVVSKTPGTIYVTPTTLCVSTSSGLLTVRKEIFPISALHEVLLPAQWLPRHSDAAQGGGSNSGNNASSTSSSSAVSMLYSNTLQLVFFKGSTHSVGGSAGSGRELLVSPVMLDCAKLRHILLEVKAAFAQVK